MTRWMVLLVGILLATSGMGSCGAPSYPTHVDARGNTGTVTTNVTAGSSSPIGTAPCGATSSQKAGANQPTGPDCSSHVENPPPSSEQVPI